MTKALDGIRVFECGRGLAVALLGTMYGDMGAEVIIGEEPGVGHPLRQAHPPLIANTGPEFLWSARNKKSMTFRFENKPGQEVFKRLIKISDVVAEDFSPGTMASWGLGYEDLKKINPGIIMVSITPYGQTGPYANRPGVDETIQAHSGMMSISGDPDGPAVLYGVPLADIMGGFQSIYATLTALYYRGISGQGQYIDVSLLESLAFCLEHKILHFTKLGELAWRMGSRWVPMARSFPAKDGDVFILAGAGRRGAAFFTAIGREDVFDDPRWPKGAYERVSDAQTLKEWDAIVAEWARDKTVAEIIDFLTSRGILAASVDNVAGVVNNPQHISRGALVEIEHPMAGSLKFQGIAANLTLTPGKVETPAPLLGQHNDYVYGHLLKYRREEIAKLAQAGVL